MFIIKNFNSALSSPLSIINGWRIWFSSIAGVLHGNMFFNGRMPAFTDYINNLIVWVSIIAIIPAILNYKKAFWSIETKFGEADFPHDDILGEEASQGINDEKNTDKTSADEIMSQQVWFNAGTTFVIIYPLVFIFLFLANKFMLTAEEGNAFMFWTVVFTLPEYIVLVFYPAKSFRMRPSLIIARLIMAVSFALWSAPWFVAGHTGIGIMTSLVAAGQFIWLKWDMDALLLKGEEKRQ